MSHLWESHRSIMDMEQSSWPNIKSSLQQILTLALLGIVVGADAVARATLLTGQNTRDAATAASAGEHLCRLCILCIASKQVTARLVFLNILHTHVHGCSVVPGNQETST